MNSRTPLLSSTATHFLALAGAVLLTASQLGAVDAIAQHRKVSEHAQVVQLERVVITMPRAEAKLAATGAVAACVPSAATAC